MIQRKRLTRLFPDFLNHFRKKIVINRTVLFNKLTLLYSIEIIMLQINLFLCLIVHFLTPTDFGVIDVQCDCAVLSGDFRGSATLHQRLALLTICMLRLLAFTCMAVSVTLWPPMTVATWPSMTVTCTVVRELSFQELFNSYIILIQTFVYNINGIHPYLDC